MNDYDMKYFSRFVMDSRSGLDMDDHYSADLVFDGDDDMVPFDPDVFLDSDDELLEDDLDLED